MRRGIWRRVQSFSETLALIVIAIAVAWVAFLKPVVAPAAVRPQAQRRADPPPPSEPISLENAQIAGNPNAKVALLVYSDFQCPYCGKFARETLPAIRQQYVEPGKVLVAFREFPLPIHTFAERAAEAALCAGRQGKFWPFHDDPFANQQALDTPALNERAQRLGLDTGAFDVCLTGQTAGLVQADTASGKPLGIIGTPTFFFGTVLPDGGMKASARFSGAQPLTRFQAALDPLIQQLDSSTSAGKN
jgi:protein-disulfide isomerase